MSEIFKIQDYTANLSENALEYLRELLINYFKIGG